MAQPSPIKPRNKTKQETPVDITQIQALAYQLWLERGAPVGSPEEDWLEAEARLNHKEELKAAD